MISKIKHIILRNLFQKKIKGYTLLYALILIIICTSVISGILLSRYYTRNLYIDFVIRDQLHRNVNSTIAMYCINSDPFNGSNTDFDLFNNEMPVKVETFPWGAYSVLQASAKWHRFEIKKAVLIGNDLNTDPMNYNLFAESSGFPITVAGKTFLSGKFCIPVIGLRTGTFAGEPFIGKITPVGKTKYSDSTSADFTKLQDHFEKLYNSCNQYTNDSTLDFEQSKDTIFNSFKGKCTRLISKNLINITNRYLSGFILVESDRGIVIDANSYINNVMFKAPYIIVKKNFHGNLHLLASDSLIVEDDVVLEKSSSLILSDLKTGLTIQAGSTKFKMIKIGKECIINGSVINKFFSTSSQYCSMIIENETIIKGEVICAGYLALYGEVEGSVYCKKFYYSKGGQHNENVLLDCSIKPAEGEFNIGIGMKPAQKTVIYRLK